MYKLSDNIVSPLGLSTEENLEALLAGQSQLRYYENLWGLPEPFVASLLDRNIIDEALCSLCKSCSSSLSDYTFFEKILLLSATKALQQVAVDPSSSRVVFVLSTTKGNVHLLSECGEGDFSHQDSIPLAASALKIARHFGNGNTPLVVSNACISGVCAQIEAMRLLRSGRYDYAVVMGADMQSPFIISGFQSFKALSSEPCRPFDAARKGLNLGEAAATIVYASTRVAPAALPQGQYWHALSGAIRNDANHISGPSRTGEGSYRALCAALENSGLTADQLACVNTHGTATLYNDEMESIAIDRAGLSQVPVNALKGYYGHTMGAAGVLECALTMCALDRGIVLGTRGYVSSGVSRPIRVSADHQPTDKDAFVKLLSGFGGCNAALAFRKKIVDEVSPQCVSPTPQLKIQSSQISITEADDLTMLYRAHVGDYPKFFKMDPLSRLGFVASEMLLRQHPEIVAALKKGDEVAVRLFGRTGSLCDDTHYQATIQSPDNFFPSPAIFVYTLPNIVTGEIAIRNHFFGETTFLLMDHFDEQELLRQAHLAFQDAATKYVVTGWVECPDDDHHEARLFFLQQ